MYFLLFYGIADTIKQQKIYPFPRHDFLVDQESILHRLTRLGIDAYRAGSRSQARRFFRQALMESPEDISTWLWLVEVSETDIEKQRCLERVLKIDPWHSAAQGALAEIQSRLHAPNLPHVSPFFQEEEVNAVSQSAPFLGENQTSPPFMATLTRKNPPKPASKPAPVVKQKLPIAALILAGLAALSGLVYLGMRLLGG